MGYSDFEEIEVKTIIEVYEEKGDSEVGIFGSSFLIAVGDDKEHAHHLYFNEDSFLDLLEKLKPFYEQQQAEIEHDKYMSELYEQEKNEVKGGIVY